MVSKKKLNYASCFNILNIPRAPRSCRRRVSYNKNFEEPEICAIELLALAGQLLQESECSSASSNGAEGKRKSEIDDEFKQEEEHDDYKAQKTKFIDEGSLDVNMRLLDSATATTYAESKGIGQDALWGCSENIGVESKPFASPDVKTGYTNTLKLKDGTSLVRDSGDKVQNGLVRSKEAGGLRNGDLAVAKAFRSENSSGYWRKFPKVFKSNENVKSSLCRGPVHRALFQANTKFTNLGTKDDGEKASRLYKFSNKLKVYRHSRIGDRRIRKLLSSKYWKLAPKLKDLECPGAVRSLEPTLHKRKPNCGYSRSQSDKFCKRRKLSNRNSVLTSEGNFSSESVSNLPEKDRKGGASDLVASGVSSPAQSFHSKDSHVKVRIKSFKVPELFVQVPETATVGSLKRSVLEAVTALLGGGMHVGLVLQGKRLRDDNRTLSQTGILCKETLDSLGFTLDPAPRNVSDDLLPSLAAETTDCSKGSPAIALTEPNTYPDSERPTLEKHANNNPESAPPCTNIITEELLSDCRALVPVPAMNVEALAIVPVNQKTKRSEIAQRRTRRPFSVSEVDALVQAVEELGTGRWRDVKFRAFENADHRTYVDLKDKWKTLVHTASISPQQRRGEPVPQELLDRVLAAHAYWSQNQVKQHGKQQNGAV